MALHFRYCCLCMFSLTNKISVRFSEPGHLVKRSWEVMEQKAETPRDKPQERRLIFSMTKVSTEIVLPCYILITRK